MQFPFFGVLLVRIFTKGEEVMDVFLWISLKDCDLGVEKMQVSVLEKCRGEEIECLDSPSVLDAFSCILECLNRSIAKAT